MYCSIVKEKRDRHQANQQQPQLPHQHLSSQFLFTSLQTMEGNSDIVFDEESLLLFRSQVDDEKCYALYSQDSYLSSTAATDTASSSSIEDEEKYDTLTVVDTNGSNRCLRLWEAYYAALLKYPLLVKSLTAFVLLGFADVIAQCFERIRDSHNGAEVAALNLYRVARFGFFGLAGAPWTHYYYGWLDTVLPPTRNPWTWTTASEFIIRGCWI